MEKSLADFSAKLRQWYANGPFELNPRKLKFAEALLDGLTRKEAMRLVKPAWNEKSIVREAHRYFHDPDIQVYLHQRLEELKANEKAVKGLVQDLEHTHWKARSSARDQFFKLTGMYASARNGGPRPDPAPQSGQPKDYWTNRYMAEHGSWPSQEELGAYKGQFNVEAESVAVETFSSEKNGDNQSGDEPPQDG